MDRPRTLQARQIIRRRSDVSIIEISQKAHEVRTDVVPTTLAQLMQLIDQVRVVLISERRHVVVAVRVAAMTGGALLAENVPAPRLLRTIPGLSTARIALSLQTVAACTKAAKLGGTASRVGVERERCLRFSVDGLLRRAGLCHHNDHSA